MKILNITNGGRDVDAKLIGGKSLPIFNLHHNKIPVPESYVIGYDFFDQHLNDIDFWNRIDVKSLTKKNKNLFIELEKARKIIMKTKISERLRSEIRLVHNNFKFYAVRSSANIEDSDEKSWAGLFESYIGVASSKLEFYIKKVWCSVFSEKIIDYLDFPQDIKKIKMSVLLQEAINSEVSGVCFTKDPTSGDPDILIIEAVWGIGEYLVQGSVTPDRYLVSREGHYISEVNFSEQESKMCISKGQLKVIKNSKKCIQKLSGEKVIELSILARKIENNYGRPMDIEWCLIQNKLYILQARPITTLSLE